MASEEQTPLINHKSKNSFQHGMLLHIRRTLQFQLCIRVFLLALVICVLVIVVSYLINHKDDDEVEAIQSGENALLSRDNFEFTMLGLQTSSPSFRHQKSIATSIKADNIARSGYATYYATRRIANRQKYNCTNPMPPICNMKLLENAGWCVRDKKITCNESRYRSIDGSCNNLDHPLEWGVAFTKFRRMLLPCYGDGIGTPRIGVHGNPLPPASLVSNIVHRPSYKNDPNFTVMLAVWGQFMDHDVTATALSRGKDGIAISCCRPGKMHPECFPVQVTKEAQAFARELIEDKSRGDFGNFYGGYNSDGDFQNFEGFVQNPNDTSDGVQNFKGGVQDSDGGVQCMEFVRSAPAATCCFGPREQLNQVSSYLDGSVVYGSDPALVEELRSFKQGGLEMMTTPTGRHLLPVSYNPRDGCNRVEMSQENKYCFLSGDGRANENLHLTSMHLLWARHHNRIAATFALLNPEWDDEKLYQEAKHVVAAQMQHITYREFLPLILSAKARQTHDLVSGKDGYYYGYDSNLDGTIANGFAAAAFRFAHTLIPGLFRMSSNESDEEYIRLHQMLFDPFRLYDDELDQVLKTAINTPIRAADPYFDAELKEHLFERDDEKSERAKPCGLDLVALNIQRGRDHGLPGYTVWREFCGLSRPRTFSDMATYVDSDSLEKISRLYMHVDDIDLYTGALSERPLADSLLGPTTNCIIVDQFTRLKRADRYWYETPSEPQAFTMAQLNEIRRTTLASIICNNADNIDYLPPKVMEHISENNKVVACSTVPETNLSYWKY